MKKLIRQQLLPLTKEKAWDFFSSPKNLNDITPPDMIFEIKSVVPEKMYRGLIIEYVVRPFLNIPTNWVTEITHIDELKYFVDEQRIGPFRLWHHEHHFQEVEEGILMTDILHYDIGLGIIGQLAGILFVNKRVESIFRFREEKLNELLKNKRSTL